MNELEKSFRAYVLRNVFHWFTIESLEKLLEGGKPEEVVALGTCYRHLFAMEMVGFIEFNGEKRIVKLTKEGKRAILCSFALLRKDIEKELEKIKEFANKVACQILEGNSE